MAAVSAARPIGSFATPTSSHRGRGSWDYAVPVNETSPTYSPKPFMSNDQYASYSSRQPSAQQTNGASKTKKRADTVGSQRSNQSNYAYDAPYLASNRIEQLARAPGDISGSTSEADSVVDLYKSGSKSRSVSASRTGQTKMTVSTKPEDNEDYWIHRDKLAQIESKELEEAGYKVPGTRGRSKTNSSMRSKSRSQARQSEDPHEDGLGDQGAQPVLQASPLPANEEDRLKWDFRSPEEIAADRERENKSTNGIRPGTSRIPIAKTSPVPLPHVDHRDSPGTRSRSGSAVLNGDGIPRLRPRSGSFGSQVLLDDRENLAVKSTSTTPAGSPRKAKLPANAKAASKTTTTTNNKQSTTRKTTNPRTTSTQKTRNTSNGKRPHTSGRPTTAHRPEGEAPWIATMYKPDPRLPQDQQIIPTHAKRLAQEQWESEGKVGSLYDRELRLLNTDDFKPKSATPSPQTSSPEIEQTPSPADEKEKEKAEEPAAASKKNEDDQSGGEKNQWPLPQSPPSETSSTYRNRTAGAKSPEHGGYRTMPMIQDPRGTPGTPSLGPSQGFGAPSLERRGPAVSPGAGGIGALGQGHHETKVEGGGKSAAAEKKEKKEKEKGGLCCIVM